MKKRQKFINDKPIIVENNVQNVFEFLNGMSNNSYEINCVNNNKQNERKMIDKRKKQLIEFKKDKIRTKNIF